MCGNRRFEQESRRAQLTHPRRVAIGFMRLMRPGSCVGPQQHYLYENQMTWVRWAAMDAVKAEQRVLAAATARDQQRALATTTPPLQTPRRPITPPNEEMLARSRQGTPGAGAVPRTPGRAVAVPGQPRKTPGKSKHACASPEVQHAVHAEAEEEEVEGEEGVTLKDELMLVAAAEEAEMEDGESLPSHSTSSPERLPPPPQPRLVPAPPTTTSTGKRPAPPLASTRPTRIARAAPPALRQRPLSAIADNRIVDRLGLHTGSATTSAGPSRPTRATGAGGYTTSTRGAPTRSKAVKDLGTLFESAPSAVGEGEAGAAKGYNLRGGRTSPPATSSAGGGLQPSLLPPPASPSKLPQRIPAARRKAAPVPVAAPAPARRERSVTAQGTRVVGKSAAARSSAMELDEVGKTIASVGLSRSGRRRRSSLGSTDFVQ